MSHGAMTTDARQLVAALYRFYGVHDFLMASAASALGNSAASLLHLNRFVKIACGESIRVPEAVVGLDVIFAEKIVWCVAGITSSDPVMARLDPRIVVFPHDVAVGAGGRVIGQIRPTLGIKESVAADTESEAQNDSENDGCSLSGGCGFHLLKGHFAVG
jgi:hypothetical protein